MQRIWLASLALAACDPAAAGGWLQRTSPGETVVVEHSYETSSRSSDGGSGSSRGHTRLSEQVISVDHRGAVIQYDLPPDAKPEDRSRQWQLPARMALSENADTLLLNESELEARLNNWLTLAKWTREVCGQWIFTWNAFYIDCDPKSALEIVSTYGLRFIKAREGTSVTDQIALEPVILRRDGDKLIASFLVDPQAILAERVKSDGIVSQITREKSDKAAALLARQQERISGTVTLSFRTDEKGGVVWRERLLELTTVKADGVTEFETRREVTRVVADAAT